MVLAPSVKWPLGNISSLEGITSEGQLCICETLKSRVSDLGGVTVFEYWHPSGLTIHFTLFVIQSEIPNTNTPIRFPLRLLIHKHMVTRPTARAHLRVITL
jgi:hypothetical protein